MDIARVVNQPASAATGAFTGEDESNMSTKTATTAKKIDIAPPTPAAAIPPTDVSALAAQVADLTSRVKRLELRGAR